MRKLLLALTVGLFAGTSLAAMGGQPFNAQIQQALRWLLSNPQTVSAVWTFTVPPVGAGTPGGSDTQVQFNDAGAFGGDAGFTYNKTTNIATLDGVTLTDGLLVSAVSETFSLGVGASPTPDQVLQVAASIVSGGNIVGGDLWIHAGNGSGDGGESGELLLSSGAFNGLSGSGFLRLEESTLGVGGDADLSASSSHDTNGSGGNVEIRGGTAAEAGSGTGGYVLLSAGNVLGSAFNGAELSVTGGTGAAHGGVTLAGSGATFYNGDYSEDFRIHLNTSNTATFVSTTGVVLFDVSGIDLRARKIGGNSSTPAVTDTSADSCGSGSQTITGTDTGGKVTVIGSGGTSCTVTFSVAYAAAPACFANNETTAALARATSTTTTVVLAGVFTENDVIAYACLGR